MNLFPQDQVFWYINNDVPVKPLDHDIATEILIVGGGMAGLTVAQEFRNKGYKVVLIEKNYCGSGASGKSSGFITPDAELSLFELQHMFGAEKGKRLWELIGSGLNRIQDNIKKYEIDCDYVQADTLIVANTERAFKNDIEQEYERRKQADYPSVLYPKNDIKKVINSDGYVGGISYGGTFGIWAYKYCLGMKKVLRDMGVQIYEETPAISIEEKKVTTPYATIKADHVVVCTDRFEPGLSMLWDKIYHVQTFLMMSCPLSDGQVAQIFPDKPFMVWDTDMVYNYFRLTGDNRLMLGGSDLFYTYSDQEVHNSERMVKKLTNYCKKKFPTVHVEFEYIWPGLIGISKDVFPIAGFDEKMPSVYYLAATCGLPVAAGVALYCASRIADNNTEFDDCFSPYRSATLGSGIQRILGRRLTFALSNFLAVGSL